MNGEVNTMSITNKRFWEYWEKGMYEKALNCAMEEKKRENDMQTMLFGTPEEIRQTGLITTISVGEFIHDYVMISPVVVKGLDFARSEDLFSLFTLSQFAGNINTSVQTGDMTQLQGYVAEQMIAAELQAKGHDVEFPEEPNNPGWDILIDGQKFQVKNLANPDGVREHLEKYPDIPVIVNEELAPFFEGHPNVYISNLSRGEVLEATSKTIDHAADLLDFEIPLISIGVNSIYNVKRVWHDDITIRVAITDVLTNTASRTVLGVLGQKAGTIVGLALFGPAGAITGATLGVFGGMSQGGKLSTRIKRFISKQQEQKTNQAVINLIDQAVVHMKHKYEIKQKKLQTLKDNLVDSRANRVIFEHIKKRQKKMMLYLSNKIEELQQIKPSIQQGNTFVLDVLPDVFVIITRSGVHPSLLQKEIKALRFATGRLAEKIK